MPAWVLPAVTTAVSAIAAARRPKRTSVGRRVSGINSRYMGQRPGGYLTAEDEALAERTRTKGVASARRSGALMRESGRRQAAARRLSGASAAALDIEAGNVEAEGRESAYGAATDVALGRYGVNLDFEREKLFKGWGAELGAASQDAGLDAQREAGLWNSIIGTAPLIANSWGRLPAGVQPSAGAPGQLVPPGPLSPSGGANYKPGVVPPMR